MNNYRKLLIFGLNEVIKQGCLSLGEPVSTAPPDEDGHLMVNIEGYPSVVLWNSISHGELRISVWWDYDHSKHPQADLSGSFREGFLSSEPLAKRKHYPKFVGATASAWLERKTGAFLQGYGNRGIFDTYLRRGMKNILNDIQEPEPNGYKSEGKFFR